MALAGASGNVSDMRSGAERETEPDVPWSTSRPPEPEPEWADAIRRGRRARVDRLREVFAAFADDTGPVARSRPVAPEDEAP